VSRSKPYIYRTTQTLPFDKLSPRDFERLCLWLVEREGYERAEHLECGGVRIAWVDRGGDRDYGGRLNPE
jgi:hypothetical protein